MVQQPAESQASQVFEASIPYDAAGKRLDQVLVDLFPQHTRSRLQQFVKSGAILVDCAKVKPSIKVRGGESVKLTFTPEPRSHSEPQAIPLDIVFEDDYLMVVNKPAGLVVHPGAGNPDRTLENALLFHDRSQEKLPRAGLVHRIDKDTTGLLVVAKTEQSHTALVSQLEARAFERFYEGVCVGVMTAGGSVNASIGRHPVDRKRMAIREDGRVAETHYRVVQRFGHHTHLRLKLETGRTHQIRVHLQHIRYPLLGDPVYGRRLAIPSGASDSLREVLTGFKRQALHAASLGLKHPMSEEFMTWTVPLPDDMADLLRALSKDSAEHS
ncbi:MAG: 23S rRNA pseudouridine(1911/1915/1917) synthase RluD [Pseudomonadota bacterium]